MNNNIDMFILLGKLGLSPQDVQYFINSNLGDCNEIREYLYQKAMPYTTLIYRIQSQLQDKKIYELYKKTFDEDEFYEKIEQDIKRIYPENLQDLNYTNYRNQAINDDNFQLNYRKAFKFLTNNYSFYYNILNNYSKSEKKNIARVLFKNNCEIETIAKLLNITPKTARVYVKYIENSNDE